MVLPSEPTTGRDGAVFDVAPETSIMRIANILNSLFIYFKVQSTSAVKRLCRGHRIAAMTGIHLRLMAVSVTRLEPYGH